AIARYHLGGVIYFDWAGNMVSVGQVAQLSNAIQAAGAAQPFGVPLLISTDQEGGSIVRLPTPATQFPGNMALGAAGQPDLAQSTGVAIAEELSAVGINQALAPDGDVNVNPANPIIGIRSFGSDPTLVADMTASMVTGFQSVPGVAATVKHFPGHGDTNIDSHSQLPTIDHSVDQWTQIDRPPFAAAVAAGVDVVMAGHLAFPALDPTGTPASLSPPIVGNILRGQLGFKGVVMTDALTMGALRTKYGDAQIPVMAVLAGEDILLMPPRLPVAYAAVQAAVASGRISTARLDASVRRILQLKLSLGLFDAAPVSVTGATSVVGSRAHRALEARDAEASVTLLANDGAALPLTSASTQGPYLVVGPAAAPVASLASAVRGRGLSVATFVSGTSPPSSLIASAAAQSASYGTLIVLTLDADTDPGQQRLVGALATTGKRLITVSIGHPYDQAYYRAAVNLALYSSSPASMRAATRVIFGDVNPSGLLPVAIPAAGSPDEILYPIGFGLSYAP
ncbi:MAG TPA: glycoside hydrolase family 3 N-terminal domain-containing protein, partial [Candidatus Limnocylindrales bacterium]